MKSLKQKRIVVLATTFPRWKNDKIPRFVLDFARSVQPHVRAVSVVAPHYKDAKRDEVLEGVPVHRFRYAWPAKAQNIIYDTHAAKGFSKSPIYLVKLLCFVVAESWNVIRRGRRVQIINAHWLIPQGVIAVATRRLTRARIVISIHGGDVYTLNGGLMKKLKRYALKHADLVVANSSATRAACEQLYDRKYETIPMGVDIDRFLTTTQKRTDKEFQVLFVGRLSREKGAIDVCKAAKLLKDRPNITFEIIGDGPEAGALKAYVQKHKLDSVRLRGWVNGSDIPAIFNAADVFVGPSRADTDGWQEAFGLVFVEAAASGLPVITTKTGGIGDIVIDGKTGHFVPQQDPQAIAERITHLHEHPKMAVAMGKAARQRAHQFSWDSITAQYLEALNTLDG